MTDEAIKRRSKYVPSIKTDKPHSTNPQALASRRYREKQKAQREAMAKGDYKPITQRKDDKGKMTVKQRAAISAGMRKKYAKGWDKRKYHSGLSSGAVAETPQVNTPAASTGVKHCPNCGCSLHFYNEAHAITQVMREV
ncbi:MAG: hypothetical protein K8963_09250 [Proteobacteria bacterium]|nr:hypothetical protein [Pseudomonadota bacterium]